MFGFLPLPRTLAAALRDVEHARADVRLSALADLRRLVMTGEVSALPALTARLGSDREARVRAAAAVALADVEAKSELLPLVAAARSDPDANVRQMALLALGELAEAGDGQALEVARLAASDGAPALRYQGLVALARIEGERAEASLTAATRDEDAEVRHVAFRLADELFGDRTLAELPPMLLQRTRAALRDDDLAVVLASALLLAGLGDEAGRDRLVGVLNEGRRIRHVEDEILALELCGERGFEAAVPGLRRRAFGLFRGRGGLAWHARVALAELGDVRARALILRGLGAWSPDARTLAVAAAGRARLAEAVPLLRALLGNPGRVPREAIDEALLRIEERPSQLGAAP